MVQDLYAETVSAINFNNGVVRMLLVDQDPATLTDKSADPTQITPRIKQQVIMPLPGFLYMLSVIKGLMEDPKMQEVVKRYAELGLLSTGPEGDADTQTSAGEDDATADKADAAAA